MGGNQKHGEQEKWHVSLEFSFGGGKEEGEGRVNEFLSLCRGGAGVPTKNLFYFLSWFLKYRKQEKTKQTELHQNKKTLFSKGSKRVKTGRSVSKPWILMLIRKINKAPEQVNSKCDSQRSDTVMKTIRWERQGLIFPLISEVLIPN